MGRRSSRRTCARVTNVWLSCPTRMIAGSGIRSSTARTAGRASPSLVPHRTTGPTRRWNRSPCALGVALSTRTRTTAASTPSRTHVPSAGPEYGSRMLAGSTLHRNPSPRPAGSSGPVRLSPSKGWAASTWRATPDPTPPWGGCASAKEGWTSHSPSWSPTWPRRSRSLCSMQAKSGSSAPESARSCSPGSAPAVMSPPSLRPATATSA